MCVDKSHPERPFRTIKSFGRIQGRLTESQEAAIDTLWPRYGLEYHLDKLNPTTPTVVEIGFGNGDSFTTQAAANPNTLFIGVEVYLPGVGSCLKLAAKQNIQNILLAKNDAHDVIEQILSKNAHALIDRVQIFFPDPWPKKRHHKRRLVQVEFINELLNIIKPSGQIHVATDWQPYAEHTLEILSQISSLSNCSPTNDYMPRPDYRPLTKFEQRGIRLGHGVWDIVFAKK